jgi:hypothetical protein
MSIMSNELNKQTLERKKVMKAIKSYSEVLALTTLWVYAMASLVLVMDIFVWRA